MCFSNLPIEFDEDGDPYLAEEADEVDRPDCGCDADVTAEETDPRAAYEELVASMPAEVRERLGETGAESGTDTETTEVRSD